MGTGASVEAGGAERGGERKPAKRGQGAPITLSPDASGTKDASARTRALDRVSSKILFGFNKDEDEDEQSREKEVGKEEASSRGPVKLDRGLSLDRKLMLDMRTAPANSFVSARGSSKPVSHEDKGKRLKDIGMTGRDHGQTGPTLRANRGSGAPSSSFSASTSARPCPIDKRSGSEDANAGVLHALETCVRQSRLLLFSTHKSKDKDHCKGVVQCIQDTERALEDYELGGTTGRRRRERWREREVHALCDAIKLHVLARLWEKVYSGLKRSDEDSIKGSLASGILDLLESNLSVATGKAFTQWSVVPVQKYIRQLRDAMRLEDACGAGGRTGGRGGQGHGRHGHASFLEEETEIQRALELFNFNIENDLEQHRKAEASSSSWEESAKHSVLWSSVVERRLNALAKAAEKEVVSLRLEDGLKKLLARGDRSKSDLVMEMGGGEDGNGQDQRSRKQEQGLSLKELQVLLRRGEELLSSFAIENQSSRRSSRLRSLLAVGEALLKCRCALERRGLRSKFEWPGYWLGDDVDHFRALRKAEDVMRDAMWSLLGLPDASKRALLECGRQVYQTVHEKYEVHLRWDLEKLEQDLGELREDGVFGFDEYRSKNLRLKFVDSSAIVIQTAFRAYRARRDVTQALEVQRERLRKIKDDEGAAIVIQRHARQMLSKKRAEAMRLSAEEEDRASIKRFTTMSPSRLLKALLEEMGQKDPEESGVGEKGKGKEWRTRNTPFELARLVIKSSPTSEICRAFEQVPRRCWDHCALLLDGAPASLSVAVLNGITKKTFAVEVLMTLPVQTQANVLAEMRIGWREEIYTALEDTDVVDLASAFTHIEENHNLSIHMLERCHVLGRLEDVGECFAKRGTGPATIAKLVEYLKPFSILQFTLGIKRGISEALEGEDGDKENEILEEMFSRCSKSCLMLVNTLVAFHVKHGPKIFTVEHNPDVEAFDYTRGLNILLHGLRCNGHIEHALAGLNQLLESGEEIRMDASFHRQAISFLVKQMVYTVPLDSVGLLINWISKHHTVDASTILHAISSDYPDFCSSVLQHSDLVVVSKGLVSAMKPSFACLLLLQLSSKDRATSEQFLESLVEVSPEFAKQVSENIASAR
ncbi:hypothetical protein A3770_10p57460 [Chloropicon primus]|uniref:Uncharacterized protein n=1 Tax=Chloropicon primus TaxID=1764295 RepID=A0A5B8MR82_9CHLO|nr:hypothetical protein A3770_10p57460 [Chloropicon primus]|eukprot:QDZ23228.1 hypothetical protein A3770_10p57460 [Chloropicon primus]